MGIPTKLNKKISFDELLKKFRAEHNSYLAFKDLRKKAMSTIRFGEYEFKEMAKFLREEENPLTELDYQ